MVLPLCFSNASFSILAKLTLKKVGTERYGEADGEHGEHDGEGDGEDGGAVGMHLV